MAAVDELKKVVAEFEKLQDKFADFGASDTEPDGVFQVVLVRAFKGKDYLPTTAHDWELYSDMPGSAEVAKKLTAVALKARDLIRDTKISESGPMREYLEGYCWRVDW